MSAVNRSPFCFNLITGDTTPKLFRALFQAGSTQAIKRGEILEFTGNTNTAFVPWDSDGDITQGVAIAAEEIKSGDRAGYYNVILARPGDVFEFALATASAVAFGAALYFSDSQTLTTSGSHIMFYAVGDEHYPKQTHTADDATGDAGTSIRTISYVRCVMAVAYSYYNILHMHGA